jgi:hypothetical protein
MTTRARNLTPIPEDSQPCAAPPTMRFPGGMTEVTGFSDDEEPTPTTRLAPHVMVELETTDADSHVAEARRLTMLGRFDEARCELAMAKRCIESAIWWVE